MKHLILLFGFIMITAPALASGANIIETKVNGMVCDFCAQSVLKVFEKYEQVKDVKIDLDAGIVTFTLAPGTNLTDKEIEEGIYYGGYELVEITRKKAQ